MTLVVDPVQLDHLLAQPLAASLGIRERVWIHRLAHETMVYGADVLPAGLFSGPSGKAIASLATADVEGAVWIDAHLDTVLEGARLVQMSHGAGFPALILAMLRPQLQVEVVEEDDGRAWLWQRLSTLFGTRNLRLHATQVEDWQKDHAEEADLVLVKGLGPLQAIESTLPLLRPGGTALAWLPNADIAEIRRPLVDRRGQRIVIEGAQEFESAAARPGALLRVRRASGDTA